jgi:hypothetical protein
MKNGIKILLATVILGFATPSYAQGLGCYQRGADSVADQLGMPQSFCVKNVTVEIEAFKAIVNVEGTNIRTSFTVTNVSEQNGSYLINVPLFSNWYNAGTCDDATTASIMLSFKIDKTGFIDQGSYKLSASSGETNDSCHSQMREALIPLTKLL